MTSTPGRWSDLDRPPLNATALRGALVRPGSLWTRVDVTERTGSTHTDLVERAGRGEARPGAVLIAEEQTQGKGRLGRPWSAPPRSGLFFSVLLAPAAPMERWGWLPLLAGVAAASALSRASVIDTALKWPNDLLVNIDGYERKCGGILAEAIQLPDGTRGAVLGMGVNVSLRTGELPAPTAGSLALAGAENTDRDPLLRAVLRSLADWYTRWDETAGDAAGSGLQAAYAAGCATLDRQVRVVLPGGADLLGEAVALDGDGRLVIAGAEGVQQPVGAGDIVHLRAQETSWNGRRRQPGT